MASYESAYGKKFGGDALLQGLQTLPEAVKMVKKTIEDARWREEYQSKIDSYRGEIASAFETDLKPPDPLQSETQITPGAGIQPPPLNGGATALGQQSPIPGGNEGLPSVDPIMGQATTQRITDQNVLNRNAEIENVKKDIEVARIEFEKKKQQRVLASAREIDIQLAKNGDTSNPFGKYHFNQEIKRRTKQLAEDKAEFDFTYKADREKRLAQGQRDRHLNNLATQKYRNRKQGEKERHNKVMETLKSVYQRFLSGKTLADDFARNTDKYMELGEMLTNGDLPNYNPANQSLQLTKYGFGSKIEAQDYIDDLKKMGKFGELREGSGGKYHVAGFEPSDERVLYENLGPVLGEQAKKLQFRGGEGPSFYSSKKGLEPFADKQKKTIQTKQKKLTAEQQKVKQKLKSLLKLHGRENLLNKVSEEQLNFYGL